MKGRIVSKAIIVLFLFLVSVPQCLLAQTTGVLQGSVTDPTGAIIPGALVTATGASGKTASAKTDGTGAYTIQGLPAGTYTVSVVAKGFARFLQASVAITAGQTLKLDAALDIRVEKQQVTVEDETPTLDVSPESNAGAIVLKDKDLEMLSDDPDELQSELQALAGPSAGPNGGQIYIDGFTGGQLPPKSSIREIRINQNPFSAEYDKLGYGRIEILTKPGTDQLHGRFFFNDNNAVLNTGNPFLPNEPGYNTNMLEGNLSGPLGKKASYFLNVERRDINEVTTGFNPASIPNEPACTANLTACQIAVPNPRTRLNITPRMDFQLTPNNTLTVRYQYTHNSETNDGIGTFSTPSTGYNDSSTEHTVQLVDTQVISSKIVNETRFQFQRDDSTQTVLSSLPSIAVNGAFQTGGSNSGNMESTSDHYELQNYTSIVAGAHLVKFGGRLRISSASTTSNSNANGTFTYVDFPHYLTSSASQFSQNVINQPNISDTLADLGLYFQDDWRIRPNMTFSYGLRYETQNDISDHHDFAPRLGFSWGLGKAKGTPKTVLRAGFGIFYDRLSQSVVMAGDEFNDVNQQEFVVNQPAFTPSTIPTASTLAVLAATSPSGYLLAPTLRAPYTIQSALTMERQLFKNATLSVTYLNSRGLHQIFLDNINAPLPGTYTGLGTGVFPYSAANCPLPQNPCGNIYQFETGGAFEQNQLINSFNMRVGPKLFLFGFYSLNFAHGDVSLPNGGGNLAGSGVPPASAFPVDQFDPNADYGRTSYDVRSRFVFGGSILLPHAFRLSPFVIANSGSPYNILDGQQFNGDSVYNERPAFSGACTSATNVNCFVPLTAGQSIVPFYYGTGPALFSFNLRVSKTIGFGPKKADANAGAGQRQGGQRGGGPGGPGGFGGGRGPGGFGGDTSDRKYSLTFTVAGRNIFNNADYAPPAATLSNALEFGHFSALAGGPFNTQAANRRIDLQVAFSF